MVLNSLVVLLSLHAGCLHRVRQPVMYQVPPGSYHKYALVGLLGLTNFKKNLLFHLSHWMIFLWIGGVCVGKLLISSTYYIIVKASYQLLIMGNALIGPLKCACNKGELIGQRSEETATWCEHDQCLAYKEGCGYGLDHFLALKCAYRCTKQVCVQYQ